MYYKKLSGFTLTELIVVIIILAIVAAIALPNMAGFRERAFGKEAQANLKLIAAAQRIYKMEVGGYYPPTSLSPETSVADINNNLRLSIAESNWTFAITSTAIDNFTAQADRKGTSGYADCYYTMTQADPEPVRSNTNLCP